MSDNKKKLLVLLSEAKTILKGVSKENNTNLAGESTVEVKFEDYTLENGDLITFEVLEVGKEIYSVIEDGDNVLVADGEYIINDNIVTTENGVITVISPKEVIEVVVEEEVEVKPEFNFNMDSLKELVDISKDGYHTVEFSITDGNIVWGSVYSNTYAALLSEDKAPLEVELTEKDNIIAKLQEQIEALGETAVTNTVIQAPIEDNTPQKSLTRAEQLINNIKENKKLK